MLSLWFQSLRLNPAGQLSHIHPGIELEHVLHEVFAVPGEEVVLFRVVLGHMMPTRTKHSTAAQLPVQWSPGAAAPGLVSKLSRPFVPLRLSS